MTLIVNDFEVQRPAFVGGVTEPDLLIAGELPADIEAREYLLDEAFGAARFDKTVERLRAGACPPQAWHLLRRTPANWSGPCACGTFTPARCRHFCSVRLRLPRPIVRAESAASSWRKLCSGRFRLAMTPSCWSATRLIMNPSGLPGVIRGACLSQVRSIRRAFSASNCEMALWRRRKARDGLPARSIFRRIAAGASTAGPRNLSSPDNALDAVPGSSHVLRS